MEFLVNIKNALLPETILSIFIIICSILCFLIKKEHSKVIAIVAFAGALLSSASFAVLPTSQQFIFNNNIVSNEYTILFRVLILLGTMMTMLLAYKPSLKFGSSKGEFFTILLIAALGAMLLVGSNDLIMMFIALETLSISSYMLCAFTRNSQTSNEAGIKYLITGGIASALLLYGLSFIYGICGGTGFSDVLNTVITTKVGIIYGISFLLVLSGFCFKLSAFPFYNWAPDIYHGTSIPVAAFLSVVSKIAGFGILMRVLAVLFANKPLFAPAIALVAIFTMSIGNLMALKQENVRRLMAYSSIAQAGYMLCALAVYSITGISAIIFYLITYLFMNFGAWASIGVFAQNTGKDNLSDYKGIAFEHPQFAFSFSLCLFSLAGMPITAGFFSKFYLFKTIAFAEPIYLILLLFFLLNTILAAYYYLKIVRTMLLKDENTKNFEMKTCPAASSVIIISIIGVILAGIFASPLIQLSEKTAVIMNKNIKVMAGNNHG